jgi:hypothetical protein
MQFRENLNSLIVIITRNINVGERLTNGQHAIVQRIHGTTIEARLPYAQSPRVFIPRRVAAAALAPSIYQSEILPLASQSVSRYLYKYVYKRQYLAKAKDGDGIDEADRTLESRYIAASEPPTP